MTREEAIEILQGAIKKPNTKDGYLGQALEMAIKALEQEPCRDMEEIREVMSCDADAETKCKMISNILTTKPHYFEKQMQEPILDKIRAEVEALNQDYYCQGDFDKCKDYVLDIIDEYRKGD